jgi:hypothetical protein
MSEPLSEDELAELIRSGRINTTRSEAKRRFAKKNSRINNASSGKAQRSASRARDLPQNAKLLAESISAKHEEPDPEWLKIEKEKSERNIAAQRLDKRRLEEMQEASKF